MEQEGGTPADEPVRPSPEQAPMPEPEQEPLPPGQGSQLPNDA